MAEHSDGVAPQKSRIRSLWDPEHAERLAESELLLYRSNLLGSDKRITNFGGGNTSAKTKETDPLTGNAVEVLWVKGSGGDLGTMTLKGFATLYMEKLQALKGKYRGVDYEDEMVGYLPHCTFNLNPRAASIDTPLHAYVRRTHVDHMHPDAIIAIAASADGEELTKTIFGDRIGWLPWKRPGYELGLWLERFVHDNPEAEGVILGSHGLFTWGDTAQDCYETTLDVINQAIAWLEPKMDKSLAFGGAVCDTRDGRERREIAARLMLEIRGRIGASEPKIGHFDDSNAVMEFVNSRNLEDLAALGTSCPDHFLRTKIWPLVVDIPEVGGLDALIPALDDLLGDFRARYGGYYTRCKHSDSPQMRDPNPVVYLIPGVGMITFAKHKATARIAGEFYVNAINVMRGASAVSTYQGLEEQEAFDIEYWLLEEAKLQRLPSPKPLAGKIALITGGAGGIGKATAERLLSEGACVALADIDDIPLQTVVAELAERFTSDRVRGFQCDVTEEAAVEAAVLETIVAFGGIDFGVPNAGIVTGGAVDETSLSQWQKNMDVLSTGYFLCARETYKALKNQRLGGAMVFIGSKNGMAASVNASAYCAAKASEVHLARCLALEGAPHGIRVNVVNPDGVLKGSRMWSQERRAERAEAYNVEPGDLEAYYRDRTLLKQNVYPEDIAEGVYFLVSDASGKSTGNIINIDGGNTQAFPR